MRTKDALVCLHFYLLPFAFCLKFGLPIAGAMCGIVDLSGNATAFLPLASKIWLLRAAMKQRGSCLKIKTTLRRETFVTFCTFENGEGIAF